MVMMVWRVAASCDCPVSCQVLGPRGDRGYVGYCDWTGIHPGLCLSHCTAPSSSKEKASAPPPPAHTRREDKDKGWMQSGPPWSRTIPSSLGAAFSWAEWGASDTVPTQLFEN